ncbi:MAG: ABATE domain-containing protein [Steroidobacteraceae bacterium]
MTARPPAIFVADSPGLDFLNSVATPVHAVVDWIDNGEGLLSWLAQARLVPVEALKTIRRRAPPAKLDRVAAQARELRSWFRGLVVAHQGRPLDAHALRELEPLNRLLERAESYSQILPAATAGSRAFELRGVRRWRTPESLLLPIAEELARFICTEDFCNIRTCEGPACTLLFADHTRGKARKWCSMAICGNRAKQAAHRHRLKRRK